MGAASSPLKSALAVLFWAYSGLSGLLGERYTEVQRGIILQLRLPELSRQPLSGLPYLWPARFIRAFSGTQWLIRMF